MRGRHVFMDSLAAHGADAIFGNPGTTENPILDSLVEYPQIQYYTALHEAVAVCAAGYYAQASGKTGVANLHVAPGLGNAIGVMFGALKACVPVVVTAGQQDTRMRLRDPILRHDLVAMAAPVCKWSAEPQHADELGPILKRAFKIANEWPRGPVFVALPNNVMEQETNVSAETSGALFTHPQPTNDGVEALCRLILNSNNPAILAGDDIAIQGANDELTALVELTGASVYVEFLRARQPMSARHPNYRGRIPYNYEKVLSTLAEHDLILMIGGQFIEEVWFDDISPFPDGARIAQIEATDSRLAYNFTLDAGVVGHLPTTLAALTTSVDANGNDAYRASAAARNDSLRIRKATVTESYHTRLADAAEKSPMLPGVALSALARALPEDVIVIDEAITAAPDLEQAFLPQGPNDFYAGRGGGIGQGIAGALGTSLAHPERLVVAASGDGSAMYSIQALWSAAHHELNILFVILANREYRVLKHNMDIHRDRFDEVQEQPYPRMDLHRPELGFVDMAKGMGVPGMLATTVADIERAAQTALATKGPYLIEMVVAGKEPGDSRPEIAGR